MKYLATVLLIALCACQSTESSPEPTPSLEKATVVSYENMSVEDFRNAIADDGVVVMDVRTPEEIRDGKLEGATELNFYDDDFADRLLAMDKTKDYYIYCKGGGRSAKTCRLMIKNGFENVHNLDGGYTAWKKSQD